MAKKKKPTKQPAPQKSPIPFIAPASGGQRRCFECNGTGQMCNICGEAENVCGCDELDMRDCESCGGNGIAAADQEK